MIDPRLHTLQMVQQTGSVTGAAEVLHMAPSTVSQQLRRLADDLDLPLLEHKGRGVVVTDAALSLLEHAGRLRHQWEKAESDMAQHRDQIAGHLRITGVATAIPSVIAPASRSLERSHPLIRVTIGEDPGRDRYAMVLADQADIAVVIPAPESPRHDDSRFVQQNLLEEPQDVLVPAGHPLASREEVPLSDLTTETWIRAGESQDQHQLMLTACLANGFNPQIAHNAVDWVAVGAMVATGFGVAMIPRLAWIPDDQETVRVPITRDSRPTRRFVTCVRRGSETGPLIRLGLQALHTTLGASQALSEG